jgi:DNA-directed RNA polymerase specialized sigma24 family protein
MSENFYSDYCRSNFGEFYSRFYPKLVEWLVRQGMRREEAVETAQEVCLSMYKAWPKITDPEGWGFNGARWRLIDRGRRLSSVKEEPLVTTDAEGVEVGRELPSKDPEITVALDARQLMDRNWTRFFRLFEGRAGGYRKVVCALRVFVRERAPRDKVTQFLEAHQLVFTGISGGKRDGDDVRDLAKQLKMTTGALLTAFSRLQPIWYECALETYLRGVYSAI